MVQSVGLAQLVIIVTLMNVKNVPCARRNQARVDMKLLVVLPAHPVYLGNFQHQLKNIARNALLALIAVQLDPLSVPYVCQVSSLAPEQPAVQRLYVPMALTR